jgi:hypothetical protein
MVVEHKGVCTDRLLTSSISLPTYRHTYTLDEVAETVVTQCDRETVLEFIKYIIVLILMEED